MADRGPGAQAPPNPDRGPPEPSSPPGPGAARSARPGGGIPPGPFCWTCGRFAVDDPADLCDLCLDALNEDLARRLVDRGW